MDPTEVGSYPQGLPTSWHRKSSPRSYYEGPREKQAFAECCLHLEQINFKQCELGEDMIIFLKKKAKMALKEAKLSLFQESQAKRLKTNDLFTFLSQPQNKMLF